MEFDEFLLAIFILTTSAIRGEQGTIPLSCNVAIVGGGISGFYVAETLARLQKEQRVCLFERDDRFGGRIHDYTFHGAPDIPLSLGAWRIDESHDKTWEIIKRFKIPYRHMKTPLQGLDARGFFARNSSLLRQKAFPALNNGFFKNYTYNEMMDYLYGRAKEAAKFPSLSTFMSAFLTPEGYQLWTHLTGFQTDFASEANAENIIEFMQEKQTFTFKSLRPCKGLSTLIMALRSEAKKLGVKLYKNEEVLSIDEIDQNSFEIKTKHHIVRAKKVVLAIPVDPMKKITGSIAEKIKKDSLFQSIGFQVAFKGFALYKEPWWQTDATGNRYLPEGRVMQSNSDCLGIIHPYSGRGPQGEVVLRTSYSKFHCAVKWGEMFKNSKESMDKEIHRALQNLFPDVDIPEPLETKYVYWEEGFMHTQRAGTHRLALEVSDWAKRPFPRKDVFIVGEAYQPMRGWIEGALVSAQNALHEGWRVQFKQQEHEKKPGRMSDTENFSDMYSFQ